MHRQLHVITQCMYIQASQLKRGDVAVLTFISCVIVIVSVHINCAISIVFVSLLPVLVCTVSL